MNTFNQTYSANASNRRYGAIRKLNATLLLLCGLPLLMFSQNLLKNPGFENGLQDWSTVGNTVTTTTDSQAGTIAAELQGGYCALTQVVPAQAGEIYRTTAYRKSLGETFVARYDLRFLNSSYQPLVTYNSFDAINNDPFNQANVSPSIAPLGTAFVQVLFEREPANGSTLIDEVVLEKVDAVSPTCGYSATISPIVCNDINYNFTLTVTGGSSQDRYFVHYAGQTLVGVYGNPLFIQRDLPNGTAVVEIAITDRDNPDCVIIMDIFNPATSCIDGNTCDITAQIVTNDCFDNNTPDDPSDDRSEPIILVNKNDVNSTSWQYRRLDGSLSSTFLYGRPTAIQVASVTANRQVEIVATGTTDCSFNLAISPISACSNGNTSGDIDLELSLSTARPPTQYATSRVTLTMKNSGSADANNIQVKLPIRDSNAVISGSSTTNVSLGTFSNPLWSISTLAAGQSATLEVSIFFLDRDPKIFIEVIAADGNDVDSTPNNGNGTSAREDDEVTIGLTTTPEAPDLSLSFVDGLNYNLVGDMTTMLPYNIKNIGASRSPAVTVKAYLSLDDRLNRFSNDIAIGTMTVSPLAPDESGQVNIPVSFPADLRAQDYYLFINVEDNIRDPNLLDNQISQLVSYQSVISNGDCVVELTNINFPTEVSPGEAVAITATYTNVSNAPIAATTVALYRESSGFRGPPSFEILSEKADLPALNVGESRTATFNLVFPDPLYLNSAPPEISLSGISLHLYVDANTARSTIGIPICRNLITTTEKYPDGDLKVEFTNNDGCYGTDKTIRSDVQVTNTGTTTVRAPIYIRLGNTNFVNNGAPEILPNYLIGTSYWKISTDIIPGGRLELDNPYLVPTNFTGSVTLTPQVVDLPSNLNDTNSSNDSASASFDFADDCGGINNGDGEIDIEINISADNPNIGVYQRGKFTITATNNGPATANIVETQLRLPAGQVVISGGTRPVLSKGSFSSNGENIWVLSALRPGQTETLEIDLFFLAKPFLFAEVIFLQQVDIDSTPNNGNGESASEDDEAVFGGQIGNDCSLQVAIFNKVCKDNGTANDPGDDFFSFAVRPNVTNGSDSYVITEPLLFDVPISYGEDAEIGGLPISSGAVTLTVTDAANVGCSTTLTIQPPATCSDGNTGGDIDLALTTTTAATFSIYTKTKITFTVSNSGDAAARDIVIKTPLPDGMSNSGFELSAGSFSLFKSEWSLPILAAGASETFEWNLFALTADPINGYAEIITAIGSDSDSMPGNGTPGVENEDDESAYTIGSGNFNPIPVEGLQNADFNSQNTLHVYPTLAQDIINVNWVSDNQMALIRVFDLNGKLLQSIDLQLVKGINQQQINITNLVAGVYVLRLNEQSVRFVKQ